MTSTDTPQAATAASAATAAPAGAAASAAPAAVLDGIVERFAILLRTSDGEERRFEVAPGQSVVEATREGGTIIPSLCEKGSCGTCVGRVTAGEFRLRPFEADALGRSAGADAALLCCCEPTSDVEIELPYDSTRLIDEAPAERHGVITGLERLGPGVMRVTLTLEEDELTGSAAEFEAGQYMQVEVPGTDVLRAYSMSNVSNWDGTIEFLIHLREGGLFSTYLDERAATGDRLRLLGPQGSFGLEENGMRPRWFIGGGCGLAPLLSMLRRMAEWGDPQSARLILGVNTAQDAFASDSTAELLDAMPELTVTIAVWQQDGQLPDGDGRTEYVHGSSVDALRDSLQAIPDLQGEDAPDLYVCGPPGMVVALEDAVAELGLPDDRVHTERITET